MTYIPSSGASFNLPVAFDANDLFCWQVTEDSAATSWPNHVPGGASATLSRGATNAWLNGASSAVYGAGELSINSMGQYQGTTIVPKGAPTANPPTNDFTIDCYLMPYQRGDATTANHWWWHKLRRAYSHSIDDVSVGLLMKYAALDGNLFLDWEFRTRLTSGNTISVGPSQDNQWREWVMTPNVWTHFGFTVALEGGNTRVNGWINGVNQITRTGVGTAVEWNSGFDWQLFGNYTGSVFTFCTATGRLARLRVSNVVRPASYFRAAADAIR